MDLSTFTEAQLQDAIDELEDSLHFSEHEGGADLDDQEDLGRLGRLERKLRLLKHELELRQREHAAEPDELQRRLQLEDFRKKFANIAGRRRVRLDKIAACACENMKDDDAAEHNEDYMSHQNSTAILEQAIFVAQAIAEHSKDGHKIDDWLEDKISKVADDMDEIFQYLKHGKH